MPAKVVPDGDIPLFAARVTPRQREVLSQVQKVGIISNRKDLNPETKGVLDDLTNQGLLDVAYEGDTSVCLWTSNWNGIRVLDYITGLRAGPYYEISSPELADWLLEQGERQWWSVDGDPLLTGRLSLPGPAGPLAHELRKINRSLLVQARKGDTEAKGQRIGKDRLNDLAGHFSDSFDGLNPGEMPKRSRDRLLYFCWKDNTNEWLLIEDSEMAEWMKEVEDVEIAESTKVNQE